MNKVTVLSITLVICAVGMLMLMVLDSTLSRGVAVFSGFGPIAGLLLAYAAILSCWQFAFNRLMPARDIKPFLIVMLGVMVSFLVLKQLFLPDPPTIYNVSLFVLELSLRLVLVTFLYIASQRLGEWIRER